MHDECSGEFPPKLKGHVLHPKGDLILHCQHPSTPLDARLSCTRCGSTCGTIFYKCPDDDSNCNFRLDLKCARPIRVLHRSHRHKLTVRRRRGQHLDSSHDNDKFNNPLQFYSVRSSERRPQRLQASDNVRSSRVFLFLILALEL
ncbi:cysteine/Histidine-rich C1 domain family protein [Striga asiatica]|uniref:Cysteine/Histidine-rich C1 domain family protein n=1 Tax=Striga asiatica TaxID=4170 RepID=A0A5A7PPA1_STRAF|nr:cysteine/Histidine-rich C1 domain family protein [Striga asiatica]